MNPLHATFADLDSDLLRCRTQDEVTALAVRVHGQGALDGAAHGLVARWQWLRSGRHVYSLTEATIRALLAAPHNPTEPPLPHPCVVEWAPTPLLPWRRKDVAMPYAGAWLVQHEWGAGYMPCGFHQGRYALAAWMGRIEDPAKVDHDEMDVLLWNLLHALADRRVSMVVTAPRHSVEARRARRSGACYRRLELTPDAAGVWATMRVGPPDGAVSVERRGVGEHVVHEHRAVYWMLPERANAAGHVPLTIDGEPVTRGRCVAVLRPVREHVRGKGAARASVTRVVAGGGA